MSDNNEAGNKRIAKNSVFLTIRLVVILGITLYTTSVVLDALGVVDYGIYNVVCGFVAMFSFLNTSMTNAIQRFFPIVRKRPSDGSGGPTTMLVGCRFLKHENGEQDHAATEDEGAFS